MPNTRKRPQKTNGDMQILRSSSIGSNLNRMVSGTSRYSGPEPQILPFPPELVVRILGQLDRACDKQNARLVCKGFAAAGLPSLTSTVHFSISLIKVGLPNGIPQFSSSALEIAMHPIVSKYITKIICDGIRFPKHSLGPRASQGWRAAPDENGASHASMPIPDIHSVYTSRHARESRIITKHEDQTILLKALKHFVNLKCMVFTDVATDEQSRDLAWPVWPSAVPQGDLWSPSSPYHAFAMGIRSLSQMSIKLEELSIEYMHNAISHYIFSPTSSTDYNHLLNVFAHLRKVSVNINPHQDTKPLDFPGLGRLLTHATLLQSLDLKCVGGKLRQSRLVLSQVFGNFTWPHLKHIGLHGFIMHSDVDVIAFFDRHRTTIESVSLDTMFLHEKDVHSTDRTPCEAWQHFFSELRKRSIKFQRLQLLRIHDCCNGENEYPDLEVRANRGASVLQYLRDGGSNPLAYEKTDEDSDDE